ncbi:MULTISPECIES: hypothetical protein [Brucella]|uniref:Uncharacterized protein n=15 Tax=Brucella TaxID=234 RepID=Q2YJ24_BRUA2|nr:MULTISPECIES: hypothetical protein [Brucella]EPZ76873.1 inner-membrane translocator [Brucella melitensis ADMAS-G1]ERM86658.1 inner-membrane translocator [Brucella abortus 82]EXU84586.1 inner-membrane translocator [Brucella melitensis 548]KFH19969.1 hypothetical protein IB60_11695 [Brucella abortus LMN1]KFH21892.1 hypothetical protein IB61_14650 [Brucella abortus LMN2]
MLHNDEARRTGSETGAAEQEAEIPVMLFDREISTREPLPAFLHRVGANTGPVQTYIVFGGTLSSWWTKTVISILLFPSITLQQIARACLPKAGAGFG